jgi:DNA polymerase-3 subunit epsilon
MDYYAIPYPESEVACTWAISKKAWPNLASYRLDSVADFLGINFIHHNALEDAAACSQIASRACKEHNAGSLRELADKLGFVNGLLHPGGYQPVLHSLPRPKNQVRANSTFHTGL